MKKQALFILKYLLIVTIILLLLIYLFSFIISFPIDKFEKMKSQRSSVIVLDKDGNPLRKFRGEADSWTFWTPLEDININVKNAIIAVEDERFYYHLGVDPISVARAILSNVFSLRRVSGASTLSMQCIRMLNQRPRTFISKIVESFMALQLEHHFSKYEILEWYLNIAPYGSNFYGIEAASQIYFGKKSKDLTLSEATLLVGIPQRPSHLRPDYHAKKSKERRNFVLDRMLEEGYISLEEKDFAKAEPVIVIKNRLKFNAPHLSRLVKKLYPNKRKIQTTIDLRIQQIAESALSEHLKKFNMINNGAVVIIENKTAAVRAMIGSNNFFDAKHSGQINYATSNRSPGSTLKPFIYAIGFEKNDILPTTIMADTPMKLGEYNPQNYDKKFHGKVSVREALVNSYNIPPVRLLKKYGISEFIKLLLKCGITTLNKSESYYGLPLILGSGEVSLLELTSAYTIFPNNGKYIPYKLLDEEEKISEQIISSGAAYFVTDILKDKTRGIVEGYFELKSMKNEIAWKTGTSYGNHDAWTIAYNAEYCVGVWLGNAKGSSKELVGIQTAAPLSIEILKSLSQKSILKFEKSEDIVENKICSISGKIAGEYCLIQEDGNIIKNRNYEICDVHKMIYKPEKISSAITKQKGYIIEKWADKFNFNDKTTKIENNNIQISSPKAQQYIKVNDNQINQKIQLKAKSSSPYIYWFINNKFYKKTEPSTPLFWELEKGIFKFSCSDDNGNKTSITITVK